MNNNRIFTLTILINLVFKRWQSFLILSFLWFFFASLSHALLHSVKPTKMYENWDKKTWFIIIQFVFSFLQIYSLVLQGRINDVRELLAQHPEKQPGKYDVRICLGFYVDLQLHWAGLSLKKDQGPGARGQGLGISPSYNMHHPWLHS